jgi:hypothetical protein
MNNKMFPSNREKIEIVSSIPRNCMRCQEGRGPSFFSLLEEAWTAGGRNTKDPGQEFEAASSS